MPRNALKPPKWCRAGAPSGGDSETLPRKPWAQRLRGPRTPGLRRPAARGLRKHKEHKAQQRFSENLNARPAEKWRPEEAGANSRSVCLGRESHQGLPPAPAWDSGHTSNLRRGDSGPTSGGVSTPHREGFKSQDRTGGLPEALPLAEDLPSPAQSGGGQGSRAAGGRGIKYVINREGRLILLGQAGVTFLVSSRGPGPWPCSRGGPWPLRSLRQWPPALLRRNPRRGPLRSQSPGLGGRPRLRAPSPCSCSSGAWCAPP